MFKCIGATTPRAADALRPKPPCMADSDDPHILTGSQPARRPTDYDNETGDPHHKPLPLAVTPQNMQLSGGSEKTGKWVSY